MAEIDGAQPFSIFPGVSRVLIPLEENRLILQIGDHATPLTKHRVFRFSGDAVAATRGEGRAMDLNVMSRTERPAHVELAREAPRVSSETRARLAVFALEQTRLGHRDGSEIALSAYDTWIDLASDAAALVGSVPVVWILF